jgi:hypothetical protein
VRDYVEAGALHLDTLHNGALSKAECGREAQVEIRGCYGHGRNMAIRKFVTNAAQRDAEGVRTHHNGSRHVTEGQYRRARLRVSRSGVIKQESDCGGAIS